MTEATERILDGFTFDIEGKTTEEIDTAFSRLTRIEKSKATLYLMNKGFDTEDRHLKKKYWEEYTRLEDERKSDKI